ncbi:hypothetical protein GCK72_011083 [Caenorhabditis remanei]|uniref:Uncharacterized protein n=1 Tax=Caenorhabditis remanei TaxID=31234 RepID=A0A6A5H4M7_CAERE|nr:hypothetical protein GCK72_011083 [Caenorhabditis remanei]KAF1762820.1 hypothetical protein GCK72_011083 [Caenorhabditis remanei]
MARYGLEDIGMDDELGQIPPTPRRVTIDEDRIRRNRRDSDDTSPSATELINIPRRLLVQMKVRRKSRKILKMKKEKAVKGNRQ